MYNLTVDTAHTYFVGDGQWLVHNKCKKIVALGVWEYLDGFSGKVGGQNYHQWSWGTDLLPFSDIPKNPTGNFFDDLFPIAMNNADEIAFNLKGIGSTPDAIKKAVEQGRLGKGFTNQELYKILHNRSWFKKTTFYDENGDEIILKFLGS